jgi:hypothetical protein
MPRFYNFQKNDTHQVDSLYLPEDRGFKYCIVAVDIATSSMDAEPVKNLSSQTALDALLTIYKRGILKMPNKLIVDSGSEYAGAFSKYFHEHKVFMKTALAGRHRQLAKVERMNQILGTVLHMGMFAQEMLSGAVNRLWLRDFRAIISKINERYSHPPLTPDELMQKYGHTALEKQKLIPLGIEVRVALDEPRSIADARLHGRFRKSDQRWTIEKYKVLDWVFDPLEPVLYIVDKPTKQSQHVAYTRERLQVVAADEQEPPVSIIKQKKTTRLIVKLMDKRTHKGKVQFLVRWKGQPDPKEYTWENEVDLPPSVVTEYTIDELI